jgi:hypothetical protein
LRNIISDLNEAKDLESKDEVKQSGLLGRLGNFIAQWAGLPQVPGPFLGVHG